MTASNVTDLMFDQLKFRGDRQKVLASNVANINTPNYKTKDVSFEGHMDTQKNANDLQLMKTNSMHISMGDIQESNSKEDLKYFEVENLQEQNDGNNVSMDTQISEMSKNSMLHNAITNSIKKDSTWFKLMVDASGKN